MPNYKTVCLTILNFVRSNLLQETSNSNVQHSHSPCIERTEIEAVSFEHGLNTWTWERILFPLFVLSFFLFWIFNYNTVYLM